MDQKRKKRDKNLATNQNKTQAVFETSLRIESDEQITDTTKKFMLSTRYERTQA